MSTTRFRRHRWRPGQRRGARRRLRPRAHQPLAEGNAAGSVARIRRATRSVSSSTVESPSSSSSVRSFRSATASKASCTSRRCRPHHVDSPEQVVTPGEELWVKIIDLDLARRRISLSIKQAAEGGELAAEYREHFEVDTEGNYVQGEASAEAEAAWDRVLRRRRRRRRHRGASRRSTCRSSR